MNPIFLQLLLGTCDTSSPLHHLRGQKDVLKYLFDMVIQMWRGQLEVGASGYAQLGRTLAYSPVIAEFGEEYDTSLPAPTIPREPCHVQFPDPLVDDQLNQLEVNINMMPIVMGDESSLPEPCKRYHPLINRCVQSTDNMYKIGYLTIHEGFVHADQSQRRPGLHIEAPCMKALEASYNLGGGNMNVDCYPVWWGRGRMYKQRFIGGIYLASTVPNSCGVWNCVVKEKEGLVGKYGDTEVLRSALNEEKDGYYEPRANELIWITDRTPHESLPLATSQYRQFFRLVTSEVSFWFEEHSTPNPLGIQPAAAIVRGNKFENSLQIIRAQASVWATLTHALLYLNYTIRFYELNVAIKEDLINALDFILLPSHVNELKSLVSTNLTYTSTVRRILNIAKENQDDMIEYLATSFLSA